VGLLNIPARRRVRETGIWKDWNWIQKMFSAEFQLTIYNIPFSIFFGLVGCPDDRQPIFASVRD